MEDLPWLGEDISFFTLLHSHKDQVNRLPVNATLIASTEKVPIAMYSIGDHIFSHQGHPEFKPEYVHDVATIRKEVLGDEVYLAAVENLKNKVPDNEMIAKCWVDFFRRKN
jgi:GMP synthase-like glutamine amidotransferase